MKAMIFAAGLGTRFKPWTDKHPKVLAPINGKSLLQRNIEYLQQYDITEVIVNVHHFAGQVIAAVEKAKGWGSNIIISDESEKVLETGGGLLKAKSFLENETFLTINGDILTNLNIRNMIMFHRQHKPLITLAVTERITSRYFLFEEHSRLCGWRNIKTGEEKIVIPHTIFIQKGYSTVALFEPQVFNSMSFTGKFSLVEVYLSLAAEHVILGYDHTGDKLLDVGKPEGIAAAEKLFA